MTAEQFKSLWAAKHPGIIPIPYLFKHELPDRWLRIHSLPGSKRYADNAGEWKILLDRQNKIISELLGENSNFLMVSGDYLNNGEKEMPSFADHESVRKFSWTTLEEIDLHKIDPDQFDQGEGYIPVFSQTIWKMNSFNDLLQDIANDLLRVFFISLSGDNIIAPYDGGIDLIFEDNDARDYNKNKYCAWLSDREDAL